MKSLLVFLQNFFNRPFHKLFYFLSGVLPRDNSLWILGAQKKSFSCNSKYLYLSLQQSAPEGVRSCWVTRDKGVYAQLKSLDLPVVYAPSLKGVYYCLRAGVYFVNCDVKDISFYFSRKAFVFNLWHGIPLKKIQFDNVKNPRNVLKKNLNNPSLLQRITYPFESVRYARILSTSDFVSDYSFASAFGVDKERCVALGYPRTDVFFMQDQARCDQLERLKDTASSELIDWMQRFSKSFVYMPTWRDDTADFLDGAGFDFAKMQGFLESHNACLILKFHPYTKIDVRKLSLYPNIKLMNRLADIYPVLPSVNVLITDYSSIYFDYLLLDRKIIFFAFDYKEYISGCRDMYLEYEQYAPGPKVYNFADLLKAMSDADEYAQERQAMRKLFWGDYAGNASQDIIEYVCDQLELK